MAWKKYIYSFEAKGILFVKNVNVLFTKLWVILLIIGQVLIVGQLQGLTREQFLRLDQLKRRLDRRYRLTVPAENYTDWLEGNREIIEQIEELDPPSAVVYQKRQQRLETIGSEIQGLVGEKSSGELSKLITTDLAVVDRGIAELVKAPGDASVDFSTIYKNISTIESGVEDVKNRLSESDYHDLKDRIKQSGRLLADAIYSNFIKLTSSIPETLVVLKKSIQAGRAKNVFNFSKFKTLVTAEITRWLFSTSEWGLLTSEYVKVHASHQSWKDAIGNAVKIKKELLSFFSNLNEVVILLNQKDEKKKKEHQLTKEAFIRSADLIRAMDFFVNSAIVPLQKVWRGGSPLVDDISHNITEYKNQILDRKNGLYAIYDARLVLDESGEFSGVVSIIVSDPSTPGQSVRTEIKDPFY